MKLPETKLPEIAPRPLAVPTTIAPPTEAVLLKPVFAEVPPPAPKPVIAVVEPTPVPAPPPVAEIKPAPVPAPPAPAPTPVVVKLPETKLPEVKLPETTPITTTPTPITVAAPVIPDAGPFPGIKPLSSIPTLRPPNAESPLVMAKLEPRPLPTPPKVDLLPSRHRS